MCGFISIPGLRQELIPNVELDRISIQSQFPGAPVSNVERYLCTPLENAMQNLPGSQEVISWSYPGLCSITLDIEDHVDANSMVAELRSRLSAPSLIPQRATPPEIQILKVRNRALRLIISSDSGYADILKTAQKIRKDLLANPHIQSAEIKDRETPEIRIFFSINDLKKYPLNLSDINREITQQSSPTNGGALKTQDGEIPISSQKDFHSANDYSELILSYSNNQRPLHLGQVSSIDDTRINAQSLAQFNGKPALALDIYRSGDDSITDISQQVRHYLRDNPLRGGVQIYVWQDEAINFKERLNLLLENAISGLILLFIVLILFLNIRLSFWVSVGIVTSFVATMSLLPATGTSINFISLFAFILVLGIVVDDAVVVGESIHSQHEEGLKGKQAALMGVLKVYKPVLFSVLTTICAFLPLLFLPGPEGMLIKAVPVVVIITLLFSLFESLCILPSHLSKDKSRSKRKYSQMSEALQLLLSKKLQQFIDQYYQPLLNFTIRNPYSVIASFFATFALSILLISEGWIQSTLLSNIEGNIVAAKVTFPQGSSEQSTRRALQQLADSAMAVQLDNNSSTKEMIQNIYQVVAPETLPSNQKVYKRADHTGQVLVELPQANNRNFSGEDFIRQWRASTGTIIGAENVEFNASINPGKADIQIEFSGSNQQQLAVAAHRLSEYLQTISGVYSLQRQPDNNALQLDIQLTSEAKMAGINRDLILAQVNQAFHGKIVNRFYQHDDEVEVRTLLADSERASAWYLENLPVEYQPGKTVPLKSIAELSYQSAPTYIRHYMNKPVVMVSAYVDSTLNNAEQIKQSLYQGEIANLLSDMPDVSWDVGGYQRAVEYFLDMLTQYYLLAIAAMYLLMAVLFASYSQPLIVLFAIPFGIAGSLAGHMILGLDMTLWSYVGMVAVSGVVVNDNLVLLDRVNHLQDQGYTRHNAIIQSGINRFRPILLTSLTTFAGVLPLIHETSIQAQLLIPMATSLGFGVIFATAISLLLVPALCAVSLRRERGAQDTLSDHTTASNNVPAS
jgi:multidrug efflux pump subunit AcrB